MKRIHHYLIVWAIFTCTNTQAQDTLTSIPQISNKYLSNVSEKAGRLQDNLATKSEKALKHFYKEENRIRRKLYKIDSINATSIFNGISDKYAGINKKLESGSLTKINIPSLDTISTSLKFLQANPQLIREGNAIQQKLTDAISKSNELQDKFQEAEVIKQFLKERRQYLKEQLGKLGITNKLKRLNKQSYYYGKQVEEYKAILHDHKRAAKKAIDLLSKSKLFQKFFQKNGQLAGLFRQEPGPGASLQQVSFQGLQTQAQILGVIQQRMPNPRQTTQVKFQQVLQRAQRQAGGFDRSMAKLGKNSTDLEMPEGFKPNSQKTKSFFKRLELGANIQSIKANGIFPMKSDIGLSLGFKLNDKSIVGLGVSYKIGWGKDIKHIKITHQGAGLRSFLDFKVKNTLWASGGFEMNYRSEFRSIDILKDLNAWQRSGLIGATKKFPVKAKVIKKIKLQLLWDFLSYQQIPRSQPIIFRFGYNF